MFARYQLNNQSTMLDTELTFQGFFIALLLFIAWGLIKIFVKHPFDNIPGPPSPSLIYGVPYYFKMCKINSLTRCTIGNPKQFWDPKGWNFHQNVAEKYGPVVAYRGLANVRLSFQFDLKLSEIDFCSLILTAKSIVGLGSEGSTVYHLKGARNIRRN